LKPFEIYNLTLREFKNHYQGYEARQRNEWERARFISHKIAISSGKILKKDYTPLELYPFPWDIQRIKTLSKSELETKANEYKDIYEWAKKLE
jgi:hypothetical protein